MVPITGTVTSAGFDSVIVEVYRNQALWKRHGRALSYSGGSAPFDLSTQIQAGMIEYSFQLYLRQGGNLTMTAESDSVVCGDVYIIAGQSNAHPTDPEATYQNEFCRTLGIQTGSENEAPYNPADTLWGLSRGTAGPEGARSGPFLVSTWGIRLQQLILEQYKMPTAVFNGAAGGSPIEANLRRADPMDLETIYGRLLYRLTKARLADKVKAIAWYQGESNTFVYPDPVFDTSYLYYDFLKQLYTAWNEDYPGVRRFYIFQVRPGCGADIRLRELQRTLADSLPRVEVLSTAAIPGHDGCHFDFHGYTMIGNNIFRSIARDFYFSTDTANVRPPNITRAFYTNASRNEIALVFNGRHAGLVWPADTMVGGAMRSMKDQFFLDDTPGLVQSGRAAGDTIFLRLVRSVNAATLTYIPERYYTGTQVAFQGPWIVNARGIGALTFHHFPITSRTTSAVLDNEAVPAAFRLEQNYPNPFNPSTTIRFAVTATSMVRVDVYDMVGRHVRSLVGETVQPGEYHTTFDAGDLASGTYFYRLTAVSVGRPQDRFVQTRMLTVIR